MTAPLGLRPLPAQAPLLLRADDGGVAVLTLNRPDARNSLSEALLDALAAALSEIAAEPAVRVVVIAANGSAFSAGHDLKEFTARRTDPDGGLSCYRRLMDKSSALMQAIVRLPQPVIAAVQGVASAAGCQLVASCDLAVAGETARFATPGVDIGLFCSTPMVALSRNVARKHAMEMLLTGDMMTAQDALRIGLVNRVVAHGTECEEAQKLAHKIAAKPKHVVALGKRAFYRQVEMDLATAYEFAAAVMVENLMAGDAQEGISAFVDKRVPAWNDR